MQSQNQTQYKCRFCNKCYKRRSYFQNHTLICEEIQKSKYSQEREQEIQQDIPSLRDMYYLLQTFIKKNVELEEKVEELTKYIEHTKKRVNILEWLTDNISPNPDYNDWLKQISVTQDHLHYVFQHSLVQGIHKILIDNLPCTQEESHPIKSFKQKPNTLYYYNIDKWEVMPPNVFDSLIARIEQRIFRQFMLWKQENQEQIDNDDHFYNDVYMINMHIMLGGNRCGASSISSEEQNEKNKRKIRSQLFHYLEQNIKNIVEYEFTF